MYLTLFCTLGFLAAQSSNAFKIGFLGDSEAGEGARASFKACRDAGCDAIVHNGDFDYSSDPDLWNQFLNDNLGDMFFLGTSGNHEDDFLSTIFEGGKSWEGDDGHKLKFLNRLEAWNANPNSPFQVVCNGRNGNSLQDDYGNYMNCRVENLQILSFGWDQFSDGLLLGGGDRDGTRAFMEASFRDSTATWKILNVHRPEGKYNVGETHLANYGTSGDFNLASRYGAFMVHGHTHIYGRTKLISNYITQEVSPNHNDNDLFLGCGESVSVINGMGGKEVQASGENSGASYMSSEYTSSTGNAGSGILICDFGTSTASCDFVLDNGQVHDSFTLHAPPSSSVCQDTPVQLAAAAASSETGALPQVSVTTLVGAMVGAALVAALTVGTIMHKKYHKHDSQASSVDEISNLERQVSL